MKIVIVSDTHGSRKNIENVCERNPDADMLIHLGVSRLDEFNERGAEWHYLQAVVFYKKNWSNESKKQLEIAMQMDPNNRKYQEAYGKLNAKNDYAKQAAKAEDPYAGGNGQPVNPDADQMGGNVCSNCISCCYTYLCVDCLFSLCCGCR